MLEGCDVRISGQDVGRGTFSHRHAMLVNQKTEGVIVPLNDELKAPGKLELANSTEFSFTNFHQHQLIIPARFIERDGGSWSKCRIPSSFF